MASSVTVTERAMDRTCHQRLSRQRGSALERYFRRRRSLSQYTVLRLYTFHQVERGPGEIRGQEITRNQTMHQVEKVMVMEKVTVMEMVEELGMAEEALEDLLVELEVMGRLDQMVIVLGMDLELAEVEEEVAETEVEVVVEEELEE